MRRSTDPQPAGIGLYSEFGDLSVQRRSKPGVTPQQATGTLNVLAHQMAKEDPKDDGLILRLRQPGPVGNEVDPTKKALLGIMLLALLVLLAACANLAGIFAARTADRGGELAVRMAMGATRWIVLRQLLTEAVIAAGTNDFRLPNPRFGSECTRRELDHWRASRRIECMLHITGSPAKYSKVFALLVRVGRRK